MRKHNRKQRDKDTGMPGVSSSAHEDLKTQSDTLLTGRFRYAAKNYLLLPFANATCIFLIGVLLSLLLTELLNPYIQKIFYDRYGYSSEAHFMIWEVVTVVYGGTMYATFLRSFGAGFSEIVNFDVPWIDGAAFSVNIDFIVSGIYLLFIPLLSIFLARLLTRRFYSKRESMAVALISSLWIAGSGAVIAVTSCVDVYKLCESTTLTTGIYYPVLSAIGMSFAVSLIIQMLFEYRSKRYSGDCESTGVTDNVTSDRIGTLFISCITQGFRPVKMLLYVTPVIIVLWYFITYMVTGSSTLNIGEIFGSSENSIFVLLAVPIFILGLLLWISCFIFGMPFSFVFNMPLDGVSETLEISIFSITTGSTRASLPFITAVSTALSMAILLMVFGTIRKKFSGKEYWLRGSIAFTVHIALLLLISRYSSYAANFAPTEETAGIMNLMSAEPNNLFLGVKPNFYWMLYSPLAIYVFLGSMGEDGGILARICSVLNKYKLVVIFVGATLFVVAMLASTGAITDTVNAHYVSKPYEFGDLINLLTYYINDLLFVVDNMF